MNKRTQCNRYTKEFKLEALRLLEESDRPATEIALQLGIRRKVMSPPPNEAGPRKKTNLSYPR